MAEHSAGWEAAGRPGAAGGAHSSASFGAELVRNAQGERAVRFRLWAPAQPRIGLQLADAPPLPMTRSAEGWHELIVREAGPGTLYRFVLPDGLAVPDPASRYQPQDVHGPSEVIDPLAYTFRDANWRGRPWHEAVLYELHVGTFTAEGTFAAALTRLEHLVALGVTGIELMPVADFPGRRDWGYDGTLPFAPDASYGRPEDLKALVDAAHARGLMVLLDVVYNHFGPEGNYLPLYAPQFFNERHHTPWGAAINYDAEGSATVREFFCQNALYWLREFHFDGLRLDAVHAILDDGKPHFLQTLAQRIRGAGLPHPVHLVLENEHNQAHWLERDGRGRARAYDAQWNDDVHHVLHVAASGEAEGYYADYRPDTGGQLGRALAQGFAFQGEHMPYRGAQRGEPSAHLPPTAFVAFIQNHDQIGNRAFGERLSVLVSPPALRAVAATYLLLPQIPMLFMGEEWGCTQPFQFFCDFSAELAERVRDGRRAEFARFSAFQDPSARERIPDPQAQATFLASKLDWQALRSPEHAAWLEWYRELLAVRARELVPRLPGITRAAHVRTFGPGAVQLEWDCGGRQSERLALAVNLHAAPARGAAVRLPANPAQGELLLWQEGEAPDGQTLAPWSVRCWIEPG
ncbi:MAG TPA: malto-oligosyltrehalose trehalohydrolase [Steroidobacteraceae bacterium]|jgi:malto-oligosyltrehalose trehalohydrolase|nr:malto-oligosyltrehalose trehalohydrolase [Steroidobacteraceae bacterium]